MDLFNPQDTRSGATLEVTQRDNGTYLVIQREPLQDPKAPDKSRSDFSFGLGPLKLDGSLNVYNFEIVVTISVLGINLGTFEGNLKDGLGVNVNLLAAKGEIKFYLKNGNELWLHVSIQVIFDGSFEKDVKLLSI